MIIDFYFPFEASISEFALSLRVNQEAYLSQEANHIILDVLCSFSRCFKVVSTILPLLKSRILYICMLQDVFVVSRGENLLLRSVFELYLSFLSTHQSEQTVLCALYALHCFVQEVFSSVYSLDFIKL